ncbi:MLO-like protein 1 [Ancistrocladus abbreviatus]
MASLVAPNHADPVTDAKALRKAVHGWHAYFWIAFIPFILLLAVGTKLEHVIAQLAREVAEKHVAMKHVAIEGELIAQPSDDLFSFNRPQIVLFLIHFILFQNAFEIAYYLFWMWVQYGFNSCIMGKVALPRLIIGVIIQVLCSYSTLPLYAIVAQMGSNFKKVIFDEHVQAGLLGWVQKAKKKKGLRPMSNDSGQSGSNDGFTGTARIELARRAHKEPATEDIQPTP